MSVVSRYIIKNFLSSYVLLLLATFGIVVFFDVLVNFDEFTENPELSTLEVIQNIGDYYRYQIPYFYSMVGGLLMSVAACFTFAMMLKNNELTALVAAGKSLQSLMSPVLFLSVPLVALWFVNNEYLIPQIAPKIARAKDDVAGTRTASVEFARDRNGAVVRAAQFFPTRKLMQHVCILDPDRTGQPIAIITADEATYDAEHQTWRLSVGRRIPIIAAGEDAVAATTPISEYALALDPEQLLLTQSAQWVSMLSIRQMHDLVLAGNLPNLPSIEKERDIRLTKPLLVWIMILLTAPYFLTRQPTNVLIAGGKSLAIGAGFFLTAFICHIVPADALHSAGRYLVAVPVLVFGPWALVQFANVKT